MSIILSIGKPVWKPIFDFQKGQKRIVFDWFSLIIVNFDIDYELGENMLNERFK